MEKDLPQVRNDIKGEDFCEAFVVRPCYKGSQPEKDADIGHDDLPVLMGSKHDGGGVKICQWSVKSPTGQECTTHGYCQEDTCVGQQHL